MKLSERSLVLGCSLPITLDSSGRFVLFSLLMEVLVLVWMVWWHIITRNMVNMNFIWMSKLKVKLEISFSIAHFKIEAGFSGSSSPHFDNLIEAAEKECLL